MNNNPAVSVIMSTYSRNRAEGNCPNLLKRALDSIVEQTFKDFELILIDDGSIDGSQKVCEEYSEKYSFIKYFRFNENSQLPARRYNDGMLLANGDYFTFMFDDDKWYPKALEILYSNIVSSDCGMMYGLTNYMNVTTGGPLALNFGAEWSWEKIDNHNFLCNNSVIVKRSVINEVGGYDEDPIFRRLCDWDLWWRIGSKSKVRRITDLIGETYAFHADSIGVKYKYDHNEMRAHQLNPNRNLRLRGELKKKLKFAFVHHGHDSSLQRWRIWYLKDELIRNGFHCEVVHISNPTFQQTCTDSDVIIYYRCFLPGHSTFAEYLSNLGKLVIYDIDDYVFQKNGKYSTSYEVDLIQEYFKRVNCFSASTQTLLDLMPSDRPRILRENAIDDDTYISLSSKKNSINKNFKIGWPIGINRIEMYEFARKFLNLLSKKIPNCQFWYFGKMDDFYKEVSNIPNLSVNRMSYVETSRWKDLYNLFKICNFDVVINPLDEKDVFMHAKSCIKFIEHCSIGSPLIVSRLDPYKDFLEEGVNGFYATTPEEFIEKVLFVKNNKHLVPDIINNARKVIQERFLIKKVFRKYIPQVIDAIRIAKMKSVVKENKTIYRPDVIQDNYNFSTGEILKPIKFIFKSRTKGLCRVEFFGSTFNRINTGAIKLFIKNLETNAVAINRVYDVSKFENERWWGFDFKPFPDSYSSRFEIVITPLGAQAGNAIQLHYSSVPTNMYDFFIDGKKVNGSLAFRAYSTGALYTSVETCAFSNNVDTIKEEENGAVGKERSMIIKKGNVEEILNLIPIANHLKEHKKQEVFISTNHESILKNQSAISGTAKHGQGFAKIDYRFNLDSIYEKNPKNHIIDVYCDAVIGHRDVQKNITIDVDDESALKITSIINQNNLKVGKFLIFHAGVTVSNKTWPKDKWQRLEAHCLAQGDQVVMVGFGTDNQPQMPGSINLVNKLSVSELKYLIELSAMVICVDSSVMQIAGATDKKIIGIFFSTRPELRFPIREDSVGYKCESVTPNIDCFGCWHDQTNPANYSGCKRRDFACHSLVTPKMVLDAINNNKL